MNRDRLERLAEYLRTEVPTRRFRMNVWADGLLEECGTAGCAGAWATVLFRGEGLCLQEHILMPVYQGQVGVAAMAEFLEIGDEDAKEIFLPSGYGGAYRITPAMVADRIEEILRRTEERS